MIKNKYIKIIIYDLIVILFWNLLNYLYHAFIAKTPYTFEMYNIIYPMFFGIISGYLYFLRNE